MSSLITFLLLLVSVTAWSQHERHYHLTLEERSVRDLPLRHDVKNLPDTRLMTINGQIPGPVLDFIEGETAVIAVENKMSVESSIHWHGILLPPQEDGVPYVNSPPILPGHTHIFKFTLRQNGTYWYHSHTHLQEQRGLYGAIRILPKNGRGLSEQVTHRSGSHTKASREQDSQDEVVVLSDFTIESPEDILSHLKKDGDYYLYKKNSIRSYAEAFNQHKLSNQLYNEWTRMGGMDMSDVGYDAFLANGRKSVKFTRRNGSALRLRIINGSASTYFNFISPVEFKLIGADGLNVQSLKSKRILLGMAETYDIEIPPSQSDLMFFAVAQDGTGYSQILVANENSHEKRLEAQLPEKPDLYMRMDHSAHAGHADHSGQGEHAEHADHSGHSMTADHQAHNTGSSHSAHAAHSSVQEHGHHEDSSIKHVSEVNVDQLSSVTPMEDLNANVTLKFVLFGDMRRYVWHINGKTITQDRWVNIKEGDIVRFEYENKSMMHHPMHLHGHFFRVLTSKGKWSPLKHTVDVPPHQTRVIQFKADEPGRWMLHCHNLYHMSTGMARVIKYESYAITPEQQSLDHRDHHRHDPFFTYGRFELATNHFQGEYKWMNTWNEYVLRGEWAETSSKLNSFKNYENETDALYRRWMSNYFYLTAGLTSYHSAGHAALGAGYILPFLIQLEGLVVSNENIRLRINRKFQWTKTLSSDLDWTYRPSWNGMRDSEFEATLMYSTQWNYSYGIMLTEKKAGLGLSVQF